MITLNITIVETPKGFSFDVHGDPAGASPVENAVARTVADFVNLNIRTCVAAAKYGITHCVERHDEDREPAAPAPRAPRIVVPPGVAAAVPVLKPRC